MEPAERVTQVVVKLAVIVFALILSLVFDEFGFGHGVVGLVVFIVAIAFGMIALKLWKTL